MARRQGRQLTGAVASAERRYALHDALGVSRRWLSAGPRTAQTKPR